MPPTGPVNRNNRAKNWMRSTIEKYTVASRRMTPQRVVIPRDLAGSSLLTLNTIIEKAVISITPRRRGV